MTIRKHLSNVKSKLFKSFNIKIN